MPKLGPHRVAEIGATKFAHYDTDPDRQVSAGQEGGEWEDRRNTSSDTWCRKWLGL